MKKKTKITVVSVLIIMLAATLFYTKPFNDHDSGRSAGEIVFADVGWDSIKLNNALAGIIAEAVYGYTWTSVPLSTPIAHEALIKGEVDVHMEEWTDNISGYPSDLAAGKFKELGINFNDNYQGFYIPEYVHEKYPDLKSVQDLEDYADVFPDPEDSSKGVIYGGIPGWDITKIMEKKVKAYGLDERFNYFTPGSSAAMDTTLTSAVDKKLPVVAYYWEPTWLMGKYDFVLLDDLPYDPETFNDGVGSCPAVTVTVSSSNEFYNDNPDYCEFLSRFSMPSSIISETLAYMQDTGCDHIEAAKWLMTEGHPELVEKWLDEEQCKLLYENMDDLKGSGKDSLFEFPVLIDIDTEKIDNSVRDFAVKADGFLNVISSGLGGLVNFFNSVLSHIPWFVFILIVFLLGYKTHDKIVTGVLYSLLISLVGAVGLWHEMQITLSIVIASVIISLVIGLPLGVLISCSERANRIMRPVLDTMQTMPVFVYLIPALLLFGMGNASGVIATVVYSIVPVIRLTSLGIRQVDKEIVEASISFGATRLQTLFKVQIPQAKSTIMTGVNQTLMMAMAMVVTCSMIGARGLGMEVLDAVNRIEIGRGLLAGGCVVIVAVILDRITQGWSKGKDKTETDV